MRTVQRAPSPIVRRLPAGGRAGLAAFSLLVAACNAEFTPRSVLDDLRVIALVASPVEAGPAEDVTITPFTIPPPGGSLRTEQWTFCPLSAGASAAYACAVPQCEVTLTPRADRSVTLNPGALARACLASFTGQPEVPGSLPDQLTTVVRYVATSDLGQVREAAQRLTLYTKAAPTARNHSPVITNVQIGGQDVLGGATPPTLGYGQSLEIRVLIDPASAESYVDASGTTLQESIVVSYYTTAGRFDYDRASGPDARVSLNWDQIPPITSEADVWVAARDLRGGETVAGPFKVPVGH
jgi:hypothetical protein